ncbi:MAG: autotransporter outer membrane beta-barrel domain-containing protein [Parvibaculaceae bacterium]
MSKTITVRHVRSSSMHRLLLATATGLSLILATSPSFADGGAGGDAETVAGGAGGDSSGVGNGGYGTSPGAVNLGGSGGGGGGQSSGMGGDGGSGGQASDVSGPPLGSGGYGSNPPDMDKNGTDGGDGWASSVGGPGTGGGGGGGGVIGGSASGTPADTGYSGGNGGNGGAGGGDALTVRSSGGGGGGGAGADGFILTGSSPITNSQSITGGSGGDGGAGGASGLGGVGDNTYSGAGGNGGDGGIALQTYNADVIITNSGTIAGGNGGAGGAGGENFSEFGVAGTDGADGAGGVGITTHDNSITIINSGIISGGLGGDGVTRANAIVFGGSNNTLELQAGSNITGNVIGDGNDELILGGSTDASFDVSGIGAAAQFRGFSAFSKTGSGAWELTGTTSAVTNWTISNGELKISDDGALGDTSSSLTIDGGTLSFEDAVTLDAARNIIIGNGGGTMNATDGSVQIDSSISGTGALTFASQQNSIGFFVLNGINTYSGDTTIEGGVVVLGDATHTSASIAGDVYLTGGGLVGVGTINGNVFNTDGIVAGGTPVSNTGFVGTLHVGGNYTQGSLGGLAAFITPTGSTKLEVTGSASLDGSLLVQYAPGVYSARDYTILTASSVTGVFGATNLSSNNSNAIGIDTTGSILTYTNDSVILTSVASHIDPTNTAIVGAPGNMALDNSQSSNDLLLGALDTLGTANDSQTASRDGYVRLALADDTKLAGLLAPAPASTVTSLWSKVVGRLTSIGASNGQAGVDAKSGGFMVGADRSVGDGFTAGIAGGYSYTSIEDDLGSEGNINTARLAFYGRYAVGRIGIDSTIGYGHDWFSADRAVAGLVAKSSHDGDEVNAAAAAHIDYDVSGYTVTPKAGLRYTHLWEEGYTETEAGAFNLAVASREADSLRPFAGVKVAKGFKTDDGMKLTPSFSAEYAREVMDNAPSSTVTVGGGSFIVNGVSPSRDRVTLGVGLDVTLDKSMSVQVGYKAVLPIGNVTEHSLDVSAIWKF